MPTSIEEITITPELWVRPSRSANIAAETAAMRRLADTVRDAPEQTFQACAELALELCRADTCGISLLDRTESDGEVFRWIALAGALKERLFGTTPRFFSPCGICVDTSTPLLMRRPEIVYDYLDVGLPFHDALLIPLADPDSAVEGTIWIVAHSPERKFDLEDARVMQRIAVFTTSALRLVESAGKVGTQSGRDRPLPRGLPKHLQAALAGGAAGGRNAIFPVEIAVDGEAALTAQMNRMREWLDHRRWEPAAFRYSSGPRGYVLRVEFGREADARVFAAEFGGELLPVRRSLAGRADEVA